MDISKSCMYVNFFLLRTTHGCRIDVSVFIPRRSSAADGSRAMGPECGAVGIAPNEGRAAEPRSDRDTPSEGRAIEPGDGGAAAPSDCRATECVDADDSTEPPRPKKPAPAATAGSSSESSGGAALCLLLHSSSADEGVDVRGNGGSDGARGPKRLRATGVPR